MHDLGEDEYSRFAEYYPKLNHVAEAARYAQDSHTKAYLIMMALRLRELHRVLKPAGSVYLHCDPKASHYLKIVMDVIFGMENFRNEIIWCYPPGGKGPQYGFHRKHDVILYYGKSGEGVFVRPYTPVTEAAAAKFTITDKDGRRYKTYPGGRSYLDESKGRPVPDWWVDINSLGQTVSKEMIGYPTQKPIALLERIISASSGEGDMVLDPFCGCATTCVAAERLGRQWIGIDRVKDTFDLLVNRLFDRGEANDKTNLFFSNKGVSEAGLIHNLDSKGKVIPHKKIKTIAEIKAHQELIEKTNSA